ncbi:site-2 protease family protein [Methanosphaera cuniculi]|uniref:Peptidase family M50 n=1 Tax=Methanosphaera cuniculi TaxID=1077256 RepID=A0A2V2BSC6_9EURY|nr:site-2 protease family protein [Methanosphaera cuniculi]PWL07541.1 peptidase family M50 [Methanosphaera cuniculi]
MGEIKIVHFSRIEIKDLSITIIIITLIFAYLFSDNGSMGLFLILIPLSFIAVGLSFLLHELGHKFAAQKYGFYAEFRKWNLGLLLGVITSFFGFVFLAPGAVYISSLTGQISYEEDGIISLAGPVINLVLAIIFLALGLIIAPYIHTFGMFYISLICAIGFNVNAFLAFFNLLPIPMFDGSKIFKWNKAIWLITIIFSALLVYASQVISFI